MPSRQTAARVTLDELAPLAGVDTAEHAYRLLRLGRTQGTPETTTVDPSRVAVVAVLARLEPLLADLCPPPQRHLEAIARHLHRAAKLATGQDTLIGLPRAIVLPTTPRELDPVFAHRRDVGNLLAGRAGLVLDLGDAVTDWTRP